MKPMRMLSAVFAVLALVLAAGCASSGGMYPSDHSTGSGYSGGGGGGGGSGGGGGGY